jgi:hypothetical protein
MAPTGGLTYSGASSEGVGFARPASFGGGIHDHGAYHEAYRAEGAEMAALGVAPVPVRQRAEWRGFVRHGSVDRPVLRGTDEN